MGNRSDEGYSCPQHWPQSGVILLPPAHPAPAWGIWQGLETSLGGDNSHPCRCQGCSLTSYSTSEPSFHQRMTWSKLATASRLRNPGVGLPWWSSGYEPTCQCLGHRVNPWSGKILWSNQAQAPQLLSLHSRATTVRSLCIATKKG